MCNASSFTFFVGFILIEFAYAAADIYSIVHFSDFTSLMPSPRRDLLYGTFVGSNQGVWDFIFGSVWHSTRIRFSSSLVYSLISFCFPPSLCW
jgi:hypothetical protein